MSCGRPVSDNEEHIRWARVGADGRALKGQFDRHCLACVFQPEPVKSDAFYASDMPTTQLEPATSEVEIPREMLHSVSAQQELGLDV